MTSRLLLAAVALLALGTLAAGSAAAPSTSQAPAKITAAGVGKVKLGKTHRRLRRQGLVGRIQPGCELGGPGTRAARLRRPLRGLVDYTRRSPRRARSVTVTRGAEARGVGIGDTLEDIRAAYSRVRVIRETEEVLGVTLAQIPRRAGGRISFAIDVDSEQITLIGVPFIAFCE